MVQFLDPLLIVALALNFVALGVSRIRGVINAVALQGILLGILPLFVHPEIGLRGILLVVVHHRPEGVRDSRRSSFTPCARRTSSTRSSRS